MTIETSAEWWREIEQNWDDLVLLMHRCTPADQLADIEQLKKRRDARLARQLLAARKWAPRGRNRRTRGWRVLLDLCAEQWVLYAAA